MNKNGSTDVWLLDENKNGKIDTAVIDANEDGIIEVVAFDENENENFEIFVYDDDLDGNADRPKLMKMIMALQILWHTTIIKMVSGINMKKYLKIIVATYFYCQL